jgi:ribonuclease III
MGGGREKKGLLSDAMEALIAALYIDGGLSVAQKFIDARILHVLPEASGSAALDTLDHKTALQEWAQSLGLALPRYLTVSAEGPDHSKVFTVEVQLSNGLRSRAAGSSRKIASQSAARLLLDELSRLDGVRKPAQLPAASSEA